MSRFSRFTNNIKVLQQELKSIKSQPLEGFRIEDNEDNIFKWQIGVFGPPGTIYEGGYFKGRLEFPRNYPFSPPCLTFFTDIYHPNIYESGEVCISILHPAGNDSASGELPEERWNPSQNILLSVISILNEPNCSSPANVDASILYKKYRDASDKKKHQTAYAKIVLEQVRKSRQVAEQEGIQVPTKVEDYVVRAPKLSSSLHQSFGSSVDVEENDNNPFYEEDDTGDISVLDDSNMSFT